VRGQKELHKVMDYFSEYLNKKDLTPNPSPWGEGRGT
jgi:hypothetical protein